MDNRDGEVPMLHLGANKLPLALSGPAGSGGAVSVGDQHTTFRLDLGDDKRGDARRQLLAAVSASPKAAAADDLLAFVQRRQVQTLTAVDTLQDLLDGPGAVRGFGGGLQQKLQLVAGLIARGFGTRIFYVSLDGFDTHAEQGPAHKRLLGELADAVRGFFDTLIQGGYDKRVRLRTDAGERQPGDRPRGGVVPVRGRAVGEGRGGGEAPEPGGLGGRRPEVPHGLPPGLRHAARRLAGVQRGVRARGEVGPAPGPATRGMTRGGGT
jgi:hypothetical protein